jgi:tRNA A37 methylthiotransferase MiaB
MPKVTPETIKNRSKRLRKLDAELAQKFRTQFIGQQVSAVIEDQADCKGRCERYFMVKFDCDAKECKKGQIISGILSDDGVTANPKF